MSINAETFEDDPAIVQYEKRSIPEILDDSKSIDITAAAKEILTWITNNVEQFIDNQKKIFKIDLIIDAEEGAKETMPSLRKLQNLYRAIPDDPVANDEVKVSEDNFNEIIAQFNSEDQQLFQDIQACRSALDEISNEVFKAMQNKNELLTALFKRMAFYYEMKGISHGELLLEQLTGEVSIIRFEYESFPVAVKVAAPIIQKLQENGSIIEVGGETINNYVIPEGFTIWIEIAFKSKRKEMASIF
jgi:hypothetical protein